MKYYFLQKLLGIQQKYNLREVGEQGVDIETECFDPSKSGVDMTFSADKLAEEEWGPTKENDVNWKDDRKIFSKVSNVAAKFDFNLLI